MCKDFLKGLHEQMQFTESPDFAPGDDAEYVRGYFNALQWAEDEMRRETPGWSPELPVESGWYWFYGKHADGRDVKLEMVRVICRPNKSTLYYLAGSYIFPETSVGLWLSIQPPSVPTVLE